MSDDPFQVLKDGRFGVSFNLGRRLGAANMYAGGGRRPSCQTSFTTKHNFRYVPRMNGVDLVKKLRAQLDANGYKDVEVKLIGDVPWSRGSSPDTDIFACAPEGRRADGVDRSGRAGRRRRARRCRRRRRRPIPNLLFSDTADVAGGLLAVVSLHRWARVGQKVGNRVDPDGRPRRAGREAAEDGHTRPTSSTTIESIGKSGGLANAEKNAAAANLISTRQLTTVTPEAEGPRRRSDRRRGRGGR